MTVPFDTDPLPNQLGDHRLVFNDPVLNSSSRTMLVGAFRLAGALGSAAFVVVAGGVVTVVVMEAGALGLVAVVLAPDAGVLMVDPGTTVVGTGAVVAVVVLRVVDLLGTTRRSSLPV
jgi:hypothetical protein